MIVTVLVLTAVLLALVATVSAFVRAQPLARIDVSRIRTAGQLDAAMARQRSARIAHLQRRMADKNYWPHAILGLALLMQTAALIADHFAHPSIAAISVLPVVFVVCIARTARRLDAQRQLDALLGSAGRSSCG